MGLSDCGADVTRQDSSSVPAHRGRRRRRKAMLAWVRSILASALKRAAVRLLPPALLIAGSVTSAWGALTWTGSATLFLPTPRRGPAPQRATSRHLHRHSDGHPRHAHFDHCRRRLGQRRHRDGRNQRRRHDVGQPSLLHRPIGHRDVEHRERRSGRRPRRRDRHQPVGNCWRQFRLAGHRGGGRCWLNVVPTYQPLGWRLGQRNHDHYQLRGGHC